MKLRNKTVLVGVLTLAVTSVPIQAQASPIQMSWREYTGSSSCTGAIFHRFRSGNMLAPAYVVEPGDNKVIKMYASMYQSDYGIKVWQPKYARVKTYERILGLWIRTHHYRPQDHGRDVWVTKGSGNAGGKDKVVISEC